MIHIITATSYNALKLAIIDIARNTQGYYNDNHVFRLCPESHRHPVELAREIDALALSGRNAIIGTLTDTVINRIGFLISHHAIDYTDIVLDVIDYDGTVRHCAYDADGFIVGNWPIGFFLFPEDIIQ